MRYILILIILTLCVSAYSAEFLIYNTVHWTHKLTLEETKAYREKYEGWDEKVAGQYIKGDVIEVRPDGFWTGAKARGFNKKAFRVLSVPGFQLKTGLSYKMTTPTKKSRFNISTGEGKDIETVSNILSVSITDKEDISAMPNIHIFVVMLLLLSLAS